MHQSKATLIGDEALRGSVRQASFLRPPETPWTTLSEPTSKRFEICSSKSETFSPINEALSERLVSHIRQPSCASGPLIAEKTISSHCNLKIKPVQRNGILQCSKIRAERTGLQSSVLRKYSNSLMSKGPDSTKAFIKFKSNAASKVCSKIDSMEPSNSSSPVYNGRHFFTLRRIRNRGQIFRQRLVQSTYRWGQRFANFDERDADHWQASTPNEFASPPMSISHFITQQRTRHVGEVRMPSPLAVEDLISFGLGAGYTREFLDEWIFNGITCWLAFRFDAENVETPTRQATKLKSQTNSSNLEVAGPRPTHYLKATTGSDDFECINGDISEENYMHEDIGHSQDIAKVLPFPSLPDDAECKSDSATEGNSSTTFSTKTVCKNGCDIDNPSAVLSPLNTDARDSTARDITLHNTHDLSTNPFQHESYSESVNHAYPSRKCPRQMKKQNDLHWKSPHLDNKVDLNLQSCERSHMVSALVSNGKWMDQREYTSLSQSNNTAYSLQGFSVSHDYLAPSTNKEGCHLHTIVKNSMPPSVDVHSEAEMHFAELSDTAEALYPDCGDYCRKKDEGVHSNYVIATNAHVATQEKFCRANEIGVETRSEEENIDLSPTRQSCAPFSIDRGVTASSTRSFSQDSLLSSPSDNNLVREQQADGFKMVPTLDPKVTEQTLGAYRTSRLIPGGVRRWNEIGVCWIARRYVLRLHGNAGTILLSRGLASTRLGSKQTKENFNKEQKIMSFDLERFASLELLNNVDRLEPFSDVVGGLACVGMACELQKRLDGSRQEKKQEMLKTRGRFFSSCFKYETMKKQSAVDSLSISNTGRDRNFPVAPQKRQRWHLILRELSARKKNLQQAVKLRSGHIKNSKLKSAATVCQDSNNASSVVDDSLRLSRDLLSGDNGQKPAFALTIRLHDISHPLLAVFDRETDRSDFVQVVNLLADYRSQY